MDELKIKLPQTDLVTAAYRLGEKAHSGINRKHYNAPYFIHPLRIAVGLWEKLSTFEDSEAKNEANIIIAATLLHDTIEDTDILLDEFKVFDEIEEGATEKILGLTLHVTNDKSLVNNIPSNFSLSTR